MRALWPLGLYALLSLGMFALPVAAHPLHTIIAADEIDSSQFMWFYGWWPHALLHGWNPLITHEVFVPEGFNLAWATSVPLPSVVMAPVTLAFGPVLTWNLIQVAMPALNAWTGYLLCRHVTGRTAPALVGGYVFGFSSYVLLHLTGGPNAGLVALVPLFVLLALRRLDGSLSARRFVAWTAVAAVAQFLISPEVLATSAMFGAVALAAGYALLPSLRPRLASLTRQAIGALGIAALVLSPFLLVFLFGRHYPPGATSFAASLANFVLPPSLVEITHLFSLDFEHTSELTYVGVPLVVVIGAFAWQERRDRRRMIVVICLVAAAILSMGDELAIRGAGLDEPPNGIGVPLPWALFDGLPLVRHVTPGRLALFVALPAAMILSMWLARGGRGRWALGALVVVFLIPNVGNARWKTPISDPPFFADGDYRSLLDADDRVLTIPAWGANERWQADAGFDFRLAGGYLGNPFPPSYSRYPTWGTLVGGRLSPGYARDLRRFVRDKGVTAIVVDKREPGPWRRLFGSLGVRPLDTGGVLLYRLSR